MKEEEKEEEEEVEVEEKKGSNKNSKKSTDAKRIFYQFPRVTVLRDTLDQRELECRGNRKEGGLRA